MTEHDLQRGLPHFLMAALDQSPDAIAILTVDESWVARTIVYVNPAHTRLSGYTYDQLVGHSALLLAGARPDAAYVSAVLAASSAEPFTAATRKHRPDGSAYDVEVQLSSVRDPKGQITHRVLTQRDVTERQRAGAEREARLLVTAQAGATARLAAGAAYQLEAPVSKVLVNLRKMLGVMESGSASELVRSLRAALESTQDVAEAVHGLKAFTTPREDEPESLDVHESIELATRIAQRDIDSRATLVRQYASPPRVNASLSRLAHVLVDLLRNAAESIPPYSPSTNRVVIRTASSSDGTSSTIEIADTGTGIAPEDLPYVFDPFFTTKPRARSVGLGLAAARTAVLEMGGTLSVDSVVGLGSRFCITLPGLPASLERALPFVVRDAPPGRRVLCVTSSPADAHLLGGLLEDGETRVTYATSDEALERLALGEQYDLVACEHRAAAHDGFRARLRRVAPEVLGRTFALRVPEARAVRRLEPMAPGEPEAPRGARVTPAARRAGGALRSARSSRD